jgi:hypothetical protein
MNGIVLVAGVICLACGTGPGEAGGGGRAYLPGTGGTILVLPDDGKLEIDQVPGPRGPVVRVTAGGRWAQAPALRFFYQGGLFDAWAGPKSWNLTQYPKELAPLPLPVIKPMRVPVAKPAGRG